MSMKSPLSPSDIEVLLHCHAPERPPNFSAAAVQAAISMFLSCGMLKHKPHPGDHRSYITTEKGAAFVKALCETPEPVATWTIPAKGRG